MHIHFIKDRRTATYYRCIETVMYSTVLTEVLIAALQFTSQSGINILLPAEHSQTNTFPGLEVYYYYVP
jgi:hypothetical protein